MEVTFKCLEIFKHLDELHRTQDVRVLGSDLDYNLQLLPDVNAQHILHA
jgi:hypothetical protein